MGTDAREAASTKYADWISICRDWREIRIGLISFSATLILSILILVSLGVALGYSKQSLVSIQERILSARKTNNQIKENQLAIQKSLMIWNQLHEIGLFEEEYRADWVKALNQLKKDNPAFQLSWQFRPQHTLETDESAENDNTLQLRASRMKLDAQVSNEEGFSSLLSFLRKQKGLVRPVACKLLRQLEEQTEPASQMGISVSCEFDWLTVKFYREETT